LFPIQTVTGLERSSTNTRQKLLLRGFRYDAWRGSPQRATATSGADLGFSGGWFAAGWLQAKILLVLVLSGLHGFMLRWVRLDHAARPWEELVCGLVARQALGSWDIDHHSTPTLCGESQPILPAIRGPRTSGEQPAAKQSILNCGIIHVIAETD
jgi:hypothetical protein